MIRNAVYESTMKTEKPTKTRSITVQEIHELYQRLGINEIKTDQLLRFEDYAWRYGFKKVIPQRTTTLDRDTHIKGS